MSIFPRYRSIRFVRSVTAWHNGFAWILTRIYGASEVLRSCPALRLTCISQQCYSKFANGSYDYSYNHMQWYVAQALCLSASGLG